MRKTKEHSVFRRDPSPSAASVASSIDGGPKGTSAEQNTLKKKISSHFCAEAARQSCHFPVGQLPWGKLKDKVTAQGLTIEGWPEDVEFPVPNDTTVPEARKKKQTSSWNPGIQVIGTAAMCLLADACKSNTLTFQGHSSKEEGDAQTPKAAPTLSNPPVAPHPLPALQVPAPVPPVAPAHTPTSVPMTTTTAPKVPAPPVAPMTQVPATMVSTVPANPAAGPSFPNFTSLKPKVQPRMKNSGPARFFDPSCTPNTFLSHLSHLAQPTS
ncbi:hypothetical protein EST38_g11061 [Candolleomyces aberdarensis]|uniref:Uncharacterized protein n=1 Tax=Candolleomyces aberdarensis TaxID=2316362 RepID=A0A4Q2D6I2_9AGAR|nr:hypothetical protein EST38_g11061 [Candolleomyces aberdarensis]